MQVIKMKMVIIGGGPAGRAAALELARLENEVILIEKSDLGGTCLNKGCMVVCGLNDVARFLNDAANFQNQEVLKLNYKFSYKNMAHGIKTTLSKIRHITEKETLEAGVKIIYAPAYFQKGLLYVEGEPIEYDKLIIATGGRPFIPPIDGAENAITYQDILNLEEVPEKLLIVGSGIIATEFASIFSSMGSEVHILCRNNFLSNLDQEVKEYVVKNLLKDIKIHEKVDTTKITRSGALTSRGQMEGLVLLATGIVPNSQLVSDLVITGKRGEIVVNERMETSAPGIYAAGDVIGGMGTTPVARMEGIVAAHNAAGIEKKANYEHLPYAISLDYDVAFLSSGKKSSLDGENYSQIVEGKIPGSAGPGSFWRVLSSNTGFTKTMVDIETGSIQELSSIAPGARYNMAYLSLLMRIHRKTYDFDHFVETHPSTDSIYKLMRFFAKY